MEKSNKFYGFLEKVAENLGRFVNKLKKMDRKTLILAGVALVLVLVLIIAIIASFGSDKDDDQPITNEGSSNITEEGTTEDEPDAPVYLNGAGFYTVDANGSSYLNMRLAASRNSDIVTQIPNGTKLEVLFVDDSAVESESDYGWGYVEYEGQRGWVYMQYLVK